MRNNEPKVGKLRAKLPELYERKITYNENEGGIYSNGIDNLYPFENELVILNSPTALRAVDLLKRYISGDSVSDDIIVNTKKNYHKSDIVDMIADDVAIQNGCFIWRGFRFDTESGNFVPSVLDVLDYSNCRISKEDANEYKGRIYVKDYLAESKKTFFTRSNENAGEWYYPFTNNQDIIQEQMRHDARLANNLERDEPVTIEQMIESHRGQVFYLNLTPRFKYALSKFDSVYNDMDSEYRLSMYINREIRTGFVGKTMLITKGLDEKDNKTLTDLFGNLLGADNAGNLLHLYADQNTELSEALRVEQLKPNVDNDMVNDAVSRIRRNILGCANNLPESLAFANEGALFSGSGESYKQLKEFFNENTRRERLQIEKTLTLLGFPTEIKELI